jgi:hypothetical protein
MNHLSRAVPGAWFTLINGPARTPLKLCALLLVVALAATAAGYERFPQLLLLLATVAGIGLGRGAVGDDRLSGRAALLFQRPVSPLAHYGARLLLIMGIFTAAALLAAAATGIARLAGGGPYLWVNVAGAFYWAALLLIMSTSVSAFLRRHDLEVVLVIVLLSGVQVLIAQALGFAGAQELLRWLLVPIDAVFATWDQWRVGNFAIGPAYATQLVVYPMAWAAILLVRLRRADIGAADYHPG